jgi:hypothetical protein
LKSVESSIRTKDKEDEDEDEDENENENEHKEADKADELKGEEQYNAHDHAESVPKHGHIRVQVPWPESGGGLVSLFYSHDAKVTSFVFCNSFIPFFRMFCNCVP